MSYRFIVIGYQQDALNPIAELYKNRAVVTKFIYGAKANILELMVKNAATGPYRRRFDGSSSAPGRRDACDTLKIPILFGSHELH